jgi:hypothetical protein
MRLRQFIGIMERRLLGAAISVILFVVERRLSPQKKHERNTH